MSRLREIRESRDLSQQQLADKVVPPTSQPQIDRLEKSQRKLTKEWAVRLARALECHWLELMDDAVPAPPALSPEEQAMIDLFRGLTEHDRSAVFRHADALAKSKPGSDRKNGSNEG